MSDHNKKYSTIQEKRIAKNLNGKTQLASGALPIASQKGDVRSTRASEWRILIDGKTSKVRNHEDGNRSKKIEKDWLNKIEQEAKEGGYHISALAISFDNREDYYVIKGSEFTNMYNALCDYQLLVDSLRQENKLLIEEKNAKQVSIRKINIEELLEDE